MTYDIDTLSGARLWSFHPDWSGGYETTRSFLTDVSASRNETEQRRALRDVPRFSASYRTVVQDDDLRAASHFLRAWQNKPTAIPDFARHALTTGASSGATSTLTMASPPAWVAIGRLAVLCSSDVTELVEIENVAGSTVTLADPLAHAWPSGSVLRPALHGLLNGRISSSRFHRGASDIAVSLACYPGGEPVENEGTASDTFGGFEVFTAEPDWTGRPNLDYLWPVEQVDYSIGRAAQFRPVDMAQRLTEAEFSGLSRDAAQAIVQTFLRMKGRRGAFYRPSMEKDFALADTATSGTSTFLAAGRALADDFGSVDYDERPEAVEVVLTDGTRLRRLVTGITVSFGNSLVAVTSTWPVDITADNVARISWMPLVRFASDELTTSWRTPTAATIRLGFQGVRA